LLCSCPEHGSGLNVRGSTWLMSRGFTTSPANSYSRRRNPRVLCLQRNPSRTLCFCSLRSAARPGVARLLLCTPALRATPSHCGQVPTMEAKEAFRLQFRQQTQPFCTPASAG
jgi:hypothetical protein